MQLTIHPYSGRATAEDEVIPFRIPQRLDDYQFALYPLGSERKPTGIKIKILGPNQQEDNVWFFDQQPFALNLQPGRPIFPLGRIIERLPPGRLRVVSAPVLKMRVLAEDEVNIETDGKVRRRRGKRDDVPLLTVRGAMWVVESRRERIDCVYVWPHTVSNQNAQSELWRKFKRMTLS